MAEHLRHEMARAGVAVRPRGIGTLAGFVDQWSASPAAPKPLVHLLIGEALDRLRLPRLAGVAQFRGFHAAVTALLEEVPADSGQRTGDSGQQTEDRGQTTEVRKPSASRRR